MWSRILKIMLVYIAIAAVELVLHWFIGTRGAANHVRIAYLHKDAGNGKPYISGLLDYLLPSIILGIVLGIQGGNWHLLQLLFIALILSVGIVALFPLYGRFFADGGAHWWLRTNGSPEMGDFVRAYYGAVVICGGIAFGIRTAQSASPAR